MNSVWLELFTGELFALNAAWFRIHCHPTLLLKHCTAVETLHCLQSAIHFASSPCTVCTSEQNIFLMQQRLAMIPHPATSPHTACRITRPTHRPIQSNHLHHPRSLWCVHPASVDASLDASFLSTLCILQKSRSWYYRHWMDSEFHWKRHLRSFWKVFSEWSTATK